MPHGIYGIRPTRDFEADRQTWPVLACDECGCVTVEAREWVACIAQDPDDEAGEAEVFTFCPLCATLEGFPVSTHVKSYT